MTRRKTTFKDPATLFSNQKKRSTKILSLEKYIKSKNIKCGVNLTEQAPKYHHSK